MIKKEYLVISLVLVILVAASAAIIYTNGTQESAQRPTGSIVPTPSPMILTSDEQVSAFTALEIANNSESVSTWMSTNRGSVAVESISTEASVGGKSGVWTIIYAGSPNKAGVQVTGTGVNLTTLPGSFPAHTLDIAGLIDSDRAISLSNDILNKEGYTPTGPASAELSYMGPYAGVWDLSFPVGNDYYVIRLDAKTGSLIGKSIVGAGGVKTQSSSLG
ncbi:MAG TPA: hypothetical protein VMC84_00020 [Methanocella sp.]|uniref:hypothetical protein n=1 Tax=Methanocella sp. TaxID=2052833 RepID=UPI002D1948C4|nr:hypothetical protein [Methanocella sp.]HTY89541.1 hypothetical protein [Methanocella sp.]